MSWYVASMTRDRTRMIPGMATGTGSTPDEAAFLREHPTGF
jgi:hypothetical protein